jgi:hypothetical protein
VYYTRTKSKNGSFSFTPNFPDRYLTTTRYAAGDGPQIQYQQRVASMSSPTYVIRLSIEEEPVASGVQPTRMRTDGRAPWTGPAGLPARHRCRRTAPQALLVDRVQPTDAGGGRAPGDMPFWRSSAWRHADGYARRPDPGGLPQVRHGAVSLPAHAIRPMAGRAPGPRADGSAPGDRTSAVLPRSGTAQRVSGRIASDLCRVERLRLWSSRPGPRSI